MGHSCPCGARWQHPESSLPPLKQPSMSLAPSLPCFSPGESGFTPTLLPQTVMQFCMGLARVSPAPCTPWLSHTTRRGPQCGRFLPQACLSPGHVWWVLESSEGTEHRGCMQGGALKRHAGESQGTHGSLQARGENCWALILTGEL